MGFSVTGAHVIFFVAAVIVAGAVSGVFVAITLNLSSSLSNRGDRIQEQFDTDFQIINDPNNIPLSGDSSNYIFYIKNIGGKKLATTNDTFQIFIDGQIVDNSDYNFTDDFIQPSEYTSIYIDQNLISSGYSSLRIVGPMAVEDEFNFNIS